MSGTLAVAMSALLLVGTLHAQQSTDDSEIQPPVTQADLRIVRRAQGILNAPEKWNRADTRACPPDAKTFSLYCALEKATTEERGSFEHRGAAMQEVRFVIDDLVPNNHYEHRLMDYNNDPHRTFGEIQQTLRLLEARIAKRLAEKPSPLIQSSAVAAQAPVTVADLQVIRRARALLDSPEKWSRADEPRCPGDAKTFSLYCALQVAARDTGVDPDRNAAIREARAVVDEAPHHASYTARLTDFNRDPATTFADVQALLRTAEERLVKRAGPTR